MNTKTESCNHELGTLSTLVPYGNYSTNQRSYTFQCRICHNLIDLAGSGFHRERG